MEDVSDNAFDVDLLDVILWSLLNLQFLFMFISSSVQNQWTLTHIWKLYNFFAKLTFC